MNQKPITKTKSKGIIIRCDFCGFKTRDLCFTFGAWLCDGCAYMAHYRKKHNLSQWDYEKIKKINRKKEGWLG